MARSIAEGGPIAAIEKLAVSFDCHLCRGGAALAVIDRIAELILAVSERRAWYDSDTPPRGPAPDDDASEFWMPQDPVIDPVTGEYS